ncbi:MAG TPA: site-2 protease family protein [Aquihabitans sp.]|nr:site-2 protease family protein [Aquihabitans sp.]
MAATPPPPLPDAPDRPEGGTATQVASRVSSQSYGAGEPTEGGAWRLGAVLVALVALGIANIWLLIVVLAIVVMITLHELGHYLMAKRAGMKVTEFFLGFGPKIWSTRRGETEYGLKAIPAGAYVKIPGMVNLDEVAPEDEGRTYRQKPFWDRIGVAVAGSAMHFLLALVLIYVALVVIGQPAGSMTSDVGGRPAVLAEVIDGAGAADAGLRVGDEVVGIDGTTITSASELSEAIRSRRGETVPVTFVRDGETITRDVDLRRYTYEGEASCGMGIVMESLGEERVGPVAGLVETPKQFADIVWISAKGLGSFFSPDGIGNFASQVGSARDDASTRKDDAQAEEADPCAPGAVSSGGSSQGEDRILSIYGLVRIGSDVGGVDPGALIGLFAVINIFIGMFNLVPLLPFDGGHVAIAVYERIQEKRLHYGERRYFTDVSRLLPLTYGVVVVLAMLFVTSLYLDIVNPIGG